MDSAESTARERAKKRVKELRDFYSHLVVYLIVNTGLVVLDLVQGEGLQWAYWVIIGWGIGLAAHAMNVFLIDRRLGSAWEERKIEEYTEEEQRRELSA